MTAFVAAVAGFELALRATLLIGAAWAGAAVLRKAGAPAATRHIAWLLGISALLTLPLFWWLAPPLPLPILRPDPAMDIATSSPAAAAAAPAAPESLKWDAVLLVAYGLGAAGLLLRFAFCRFMVSRLWREADPAPDATWQCLLCRLARELRLPVAVELRIARGTVMPMTWGTLAPKVLLPAEACTWPAEQRRLVLLHELAHVARRDSLSRSAASLACAFYWFHPAVWLAVRQMRMEQEHAADDRVLTAGAAAQGYALSLLHLAARVSETPRPDHAAAMAGMCQLERRLVAITTPARRERPGAAFVHGSGAIAACVTLAVASGIPVRPTPPSSPLQAEPARFASPDRPETADLAADNGTQTAPQAQGDIVAERSRDHGNGRDAARIGVPVDRAELPAPTLAAQPAATPGPDPATAAGDHASVDSTIAARFATYGPTLTQRAAETQGPDPRIPEMTRPDGGDPPNRVGRRLRLPVMFGSSPGPPGVPRVTLSWDQAWP